MSYEIVEPNAWIFSLNFGFLDHETYTGAKMEIGIALLAALIPLVVLAVQLWQYLDQKKSELRDKRFVIFHGLIRDLVEPSQGKPS